MFWFYIRADIWFIVFLWELKEYKLAKPALPTISLQKLLQFRTLDFFFFIKKVFLLRKDLYFVLLEKLAFAFFKWGFTSYEAVQPLQPMELLEKKKKMARM